MVNTSNLALITCSYGPDLERCRRLCASVDKYVPAGIEHTLIVPQRDYSMFAEFKNRRRSLLITEEVVPGRFIQVPMLRKWWLSESRWPVRGWIMQQITKMSANRAIT